MVVAKLERNAVPREHMLISKRVVVVAVKIIGTGRTGAPRTGADPPIQPRSRPSRNLRMRYLRRTRTRLWSRKMTRSLSRRSRSLNYPSRTICRTRKRMRLWSRMMMSRKMMRLKEKRVAAPEFYYCKNKKSL